MEAGGGVVGGGIVATVDTVEGTKVDEVGGCCVVDVSGAAVVGGTVVCGGAVVPVGAGVVTTGGRVVPVVPEGAGAAVTVVVESAGGAAVVEVEVEVDAIDVVEDPVVLVGRAVVVGDCVATCCLGELSVPVATSNRRAARATAAMA